MRRHTYYITFFFFNDTATTEIYTLSLHDALPISEYRVWVTSPRRNPVYNANRMASFSSSSARARMRLRNLIEYFCFAGLVTLGHSFSRSGNSLTPTDLRKARRIVRCSRMVEFCRSARRVGTFARNQSM